MDNNQFSQTETPGTSQTVPSQNTPNVQSTPSYPNYPYFPNQTNKVVGVGTFFGLMLLFALPFVGWIACIIAAFAPQNQNIKNYARAILLWLIIGIVLAILWVALIGGAGHAIGSSILGGYLY